MKTGHLQYLLHIIIALSLPFAFVSCDYLPVERHGGTSFRMQVDSIKGTQAIFTVAPEDDRVYYYTDVMTVSQYDSICRSYGSAKAAANAVLKESYGVEYKQRVEYYKKDLGHKYISPFKNIGLYYGEASQMFVNLMPCTDYYAVAFCVDCVNDSTFLAAGDVQTLKFTTTDIQLNKSHMVLDYMIRDTKKGFFFYSKPTYSGLDLQHDGKICRDPYLVSIVSDAELNEVYGGDVFEYALNYYAMAQVTETLNEILRRDIHRTSAYLTGWEGQGFTIIGAPFNITNLNKLYILHFTYRKGMNVNYTHTTVEK